MSSSRAVCVYCSSSNAVAPEFFAAANSLGEALARRNFGLVFGGTNVGLMGAVARSAHEHGARVTGVMPQAFAANNIAFDLADELVVTADLRERKATMEARSDAFITLPGGFGTLEEVLEILTLKQLQFHTKPVVFLNANGFYDHLVEFFERLSADHFLKPGAPLYYIAADAEDALDYIERYEPVTDTGAWF
jgi:cytokinin riboside 5'-monophosphate phosphoribohydrolase